MGLRDNKNAQIVYHGQSCHARMTTSIAAIDIT